MADKELRRMNRTELIEIIYALQQNEQKLREENDKMTAELEDRKIRMDESGSIAEAALSLNHIFEDAQAAADQYLLSLQRGEEEQPELTPDLSEKAEPESDGTESEAEKGEPESDSETGEESSEPEEILEDARRQADQILEDARREADSILTTARAQAEPATGNGTGDTESESEKILENARRQADEILNKAQQEADDILESAHRDAQTESQKTLEETKEQCDKERQAVKDYHDRFLRDMSDILKENPELLARVQKMGTVEGA